MRSMSLLLGVMTLALTLAACGGSKTTPDPAPYNPPPDNTNTAPAPQAKTVMLYNYRFNPNTLTIPAGTVVTFRNKDPERHNVNIQQLNVDQMVDPQGSFSYTFNARGSYTVVNRLANTPMQITIIVQ